MGVLVIGRVMWYSTTFSEEQSSVLVTIYLF